MTHFDPTDKAQRGLDPRAFTGGGRSRSVSTRKQLRACCLGIIVIIAGAVILALLFPLLASLTR